MYGEVDTSMQCKSVLVTPDHCNVRGSSKSVLATPDHCNVRGSSKSVLTTPDHCNVRGSSKSVLATPDHCNVRSSSKSVLATTDHCNVRGSSKNVIATPDQWSILYTEAWSLHAPRSDRGAAPHYPIVKHNPTMLLIGYTCDRCHSFSRITDSRFKQERSGPTPPLIR